MASFHNSGYVAAIGVTLIAFFSSVANVEQQPPWEGCRAASKTEYESAKRVFCCKPVLARMQGPATGGGVTIGIVTYSSEGRLWENG